MAAEPVERTRHGREPLAQPRGVQPPADRLEPEPLAAEPVAHQLVEPPHPGRKSLAQALDHRGGAAQPEPFGQIVEPLGGHGQEPARLRQPASEPREAFPAGPELAQDRAVEPLPQAGDPPEEIGPDRHRDLGGGGRRGCPPVGGEIDQRVVGLVSHGRDQRDRRGGRGAHDDLLVEGPEILDRAATPGDDHDVRPRDPPARRQGREAADGGRHLLGRAFALDLDRPEDHPHREAIGEPVQDVADHRPGWRGDHAHDPRQKGQRPLAAGVEQALGRELALALLEQRHERAQAGRLHPLDHELVLGAAGIRGEPAGADDLEAVLGLETQPR